MSKNSKNNNNYVGVYSMNGEINTKNLDTHYVTEYPVAAMNFNLDANNVSSFPVNKNINGFIKE